MSFPNAQDLATQADVRIAGVSVGKVVSTPLDPKGNRTMATIQLEHQYSPIRTGHARDPADQDDPRRDLRAADPGLAERAADGRRRHAAAQPGAARRSSSRTSSTRSIRPPGTRSRSGSSSWPRRSRGNDQNLNDVLGNLPSFAADATDILQVLDVQHHAVVSLVQNGGTVFGALGADQTALRNLITSARDDVRHDRRQQQQARRRPSRCSRRS